MRCIIFTCLLAMVSIGHTSFATNDKKGGGDKSSSAEKKDPKNKQPGGGSGEMGKRYSCMNNGKC